MAHRNEKTKSSPPLAIDLFAGGGGLTVGLKKAGFKVLSAVEIEPHAAATYRVNHPDVQLLTQDVCTVSGKDLTKHANRRVDLLAGCPPCQGFSSLTQKYKRDDPRNFLIREMGRLVEELLPRAIMMENVPGLTKKGKPLFDAFLAKIESLGYVVTWRVLQVADYGVPQNRKRLVLLAGHKFPIEIPAATHSREPKAGQKPWKTVRDALKNMERPIPLDVAQKKGSPSDFNWHIVRKLSAVNKARLLRAKPGKSWTSIPKKLRPPCHGDRSAGFSNVYGRMAWDDISPTITGGCVTLSMGRFGHPSQLRTISVREAALLQTFPKGYRFETPYVEQVCNIIGNALPCDFAAAISKSVLQQIEG